MALALTLVAPGVATVHAHSDGAGVAEERVAAALPAAIAVETRQAASEQADAAEGVEPAVQAKRHLRRVRHEELTSELMTASAELLKQHHTDRLGSEIELGVSGRRYVARIERHFHPEGGNAKPWGYHPGVSLFVVLR